MPSFGLHPWYVSRRCRDWKHKLTALLNLLPGAGIGEIGLDFTLDSESISDQKSVFTEQIMLAKDMKRPASIHCQKAWQPLLEIITDAGPLPAGFLIHSYSGSAELINQISGLDGFFSFSGSITYPNNRRGISALASAPPDRILAETDSPDIMPSSHTAATPQPDSVPPGINEPANLPTIVRKIASVRGITEEKAAGMIFSNACRFFGVHPESGQ